MEEGGLGYWLGIKVNLPPKCFGIVFEFLSIPKDYKCRFTGDSVLKVRSNSLLTATKQISINTAHLCS